jgi:hypothetical protein
MEGELCEIYTKQNQMPFGIHTSEPRHPFKPQVASSRPNLSVGATGVRDHFISHSPPLVCNQLTQRNWTLAKPERTAIIRTVNEQPEGTELVQILNIWVCKGAASNAMLDFASLVTLVHTWNCFAVRTKDSGTPCLLVFAATCLFALQAIMSDLCSHHSLGTKTLKRRLQHTKSYKDTKCMLRSFQHAFWSGSFDLISLVDGTSFFEVSLFLVRQAACLRMKVWCRSAVLNRKQLGKQLWYSWDTEWNLVESCIHKM